VDALQAQVHGEQAVGQSLLHPALDAGQVLPHFFCDLRRRGKEASGDETRHELVKRSGGSRVLVPESPTAGTRR